MVMTALGLSNTDLGVQRALTGQSVQDLHKHTARLERIAKAANMSVDELLALRTDPIVKGAMLRANLTVPILDAIEAGRRHRWNRPPRGR